MFRLLQCYLNQNDGRGTCPSSLQFLYLKFVAILHHQTSARAVNAPTRIAVKLVENIFNLNKELRVFTDIEAAAQIKQTITGKAREKRDGSVIVDNTHSVDNRAEWQQPVLDLRQRFAGCRQNSASRGALSGCAGRGQSTNACAAPEEILNLRP